MPSTPSTSPAPAPAPHIELLRQLVRLDPLCASNTTHHLQLSLPSATSDISPLATSLPVGKDAEVCSHIQQLVSAASILIGTVPASPPSGATGCALLPASLNMARSSSASGYSLRTLLQPYICLLRSLAALDPPRVGQIPDDYVCGWVTILIRWARTICEHLLEEKQEVSPGRASESI
ncbi:hypothetical protein F5B21DRAFT_97985 [Xylaria acuta]|nr:hypothetical protein F5B21DRAFT_97985 [Xylaria acuta]